MKLAKWSANSSLTRNPSSVFLDTDGWISEELHVAYKCPLKVDSTETQT